jgi:hypothetical protein
MPNLEATKAIIVLWMLETLLEEGTLQKEDVLAKVDISEISYKRYIGTLREYLRDFHPSWQIVYKKSRHSYLLDKGKNAF